MTSVSAFPYGSAAAAGAGGGGDTVTLSGESTSISVTNPTDAYARIKIDNDGNVYESADTGSASWVQVDSSTDWVRPASSAPGTYQVRFTSATNTPTSSTAAEDTWYALSGGDFIIYNSRTIVGIKSTTFTIEIRQGTGSVLDSASYSLFAEVLFDEILL